MTEAVVTGGAGFIGSHVVEHLVEKGHNVRIVDNLCRGQRRNIENLLATDKVTLHELNIVADDLSDVFAGAKWVFHLAALADIVPSVEQPLPYHHTNVDGTLYVLEAARVAGVERFVYAASSSCYGIPDAYPTPESAPARPQYPYALTKHLGEQMVMHWAQLYDLPAVSLRFFNVYGPRVRTSGAYGAVFGVFLAQKLAGIPFTVVGDGNQTRDFTFVTDVAEACVRAASSELQGEILNVGSGHAQSVNRLVELLGGDVVHIPKRPGEPDCTLADVSKVQKLLGWQARVSFEDGVAQMLANIEYWRDAPLWTPKSIAKATKAWFSNLDGKD